MSQDKEQQIKNILERQLQKNSDLSLVSLLEQVMSIIRPSREERRELERETAILYLEHIKEGYQKNKSNFQETGMVSALDIQEQRVRRITREEYFQHRDRYFSMGTKEAKAFRQQKALAGEK